MTHERTLAGLRGFAGMDADKRRAIAKKGGASDLSPVWSLT